MRRPPGGEGEAEPPVLARQVRRPELQQQTGLRMGAGGEGGLPRPLLLHRLRDRGRDRLRVSSRG